MNTILMTLIIALGSFIGGIFYSRTKADPWQSFCADTKRLFRAVGRGFQRMFERSGTNE